MTLPHDTPATPASARRRGAGLLPLLALVAMTVGASATIHAITGSHELGDDAQHFIRFSRQPLAILGDYREAHFSDRWGSFPPLFPILFGGLLRQ